MDGYSGEEMIGKYAGLLVPDDRAGEMHAKLGTVRGGHCVQRLETVRVHKDGTGVAVSITVTPIHDEDGVVAGAAAVHRDVTEHQCGGPARSQRSGWSTAAQCAVLSSRALPAGKSGEAVTS